MVGGVSMDEFNIAILEDLDRHEADILSRLNAEPGAGLRILVDPVAVLDTVACARTIPPYTGQLSF